MKALAATALAVLLAAGAARADDYPSRAIRILVPYSAGGTSDTAARLISEPLGRALGQSVYVENRGGAGGLTATEAFFALPQDGYTLLLTGAGPTAIIPPVKPVSYRPEDMVALGSIWRSPQLLAVNPKLGIKSLDEFLARARQKPGTVTIGSAGVGALTHLSIELLKRESKIDVIHVPFRSTGGTLPALIGGQIDATFGDVSLMAEHAKSGAVTALAIASRTRSPLLPDLKTFAEAGLPNVLAENWYGLVVSTKTPAPVVAKLRAAMLTAQNDPAYRASLVRQGVSSGEPGAGSLAKLMQDEIARWKAVVTAPGVKLE